MSDSVRPQRQQPIGSLVAPLSLGFSRQVHWSGLPFPSPTHESEKWKWSRSVMSDSSRPHGCSLPGPSVHGIFQARVLEWVAIAFSSHGRQCCVKHTTGLSQCDKIVWNRASAKCKSGDQIRLLIFPPIIQIFAFSEISQIWTGPLE